MNDGLSQEINGNMMHRPAKKNQKKKKTVFAGQKLLSVEIDETFLKVHTKNLVRVTGNGEVKSRKGPSTLRRLSFRFPH